MFVLQKMNQMVEFPVTGLSLHDALYTTQVSRGSRGGRFSMGSRGNRDSRCGRDSRDSKDRWNIV